MAANGSLISDSTVAFDGSITNPLTDRFNVFFNTDDGLEYELVTDGAQAPFRNVWVDPDTGDITAVGSATFRAIPEPASLALLGLGGLAMIGRRKTNA